MEKPSAIPFIKVIREEAKEKTESGANNVRSEKPPPSIKKKIAYTLIRRDEIGTGTACG